MTIFNLLLLVLILVFSTESMAVPGCASSQTVSYDYDELLLVLQWPTSFCNTRYCDYDQIPNEFKVHGLWPNKNSASVCCPPIWPPLQISGDLRGDLWQEMLTYWPNLENQAYPERFWVHEYEKHGSCFTEFNNQVEYFQTALAIAKDIGDVMTMRLSLGQPLQTGKYYHVKDFEQVTIASSTRRLFPSLRCNYAKAGPYPQFQLHEIVFCTDTCMNLKTCTYNFNSCNKGNGEFFFPQVPASSRSPPSASLSSSSRSPPSVAWNDEFFCPQVPAPLPGPSLPPPPVARNGGFSSRSPPWFAFWIHASASGFFFFVFFL